MAIFQVQLGQTGSPLVFFRHLFQKAFGIVAQVFLRAGCPSCHPTNSVKTLKETQSHEPQQWLMLSSSITVFLKESTLLPHAACLTPLLCQHHTPQDLHVQIFPTDLHRKYFGYC